MDGDTRGDDYAIDILRGRKMRHWPIISMDVVAIYFGFYVFFRLWLGCGFVLRRRHCHVFLRV